MIPTHFWYRSTTQFPFQTTPNALGVMRVEDRLSVPSRNGPIHRDTLRPAVMDEIIVMGRVASSLIAPASSW